MELKKYNYFSNLKYITTKHWKYDKKYVLLLVGSIFIDVLLSLITAILPKLVLDCIEKKVNPSTMIINIILVVSIQLVLQFLNNYCKSYTNRGYDLSRMELFRFSYFSKLIEMDYNNFKYGNTRILKGKAFSAISNHNTGAPTFLELNQKLYSSILGFISFVLIITRFNYWFVPILICSYALSGLGWGVLQKYKTKIKEERAKILLKLNYLTFQTKDFASAKDIRLYNMSDFLLNKINENIEDNLKYDTKESNGLFANNVLQDILKYAVILGAYLYLIKIKLSSNMTIGDFTLCFGAITGFSVWLSNLIESLSKIIECSHNVGDYREFLNLPNREIGNINCENTNEKDKYAIVLKDVVFSYENSQKPVLNKISFSIKYGERIAIVGINGAGKSTLVNIITGLLHPDSGNVYIDGENIYSYNSDELFEKFTTVFQDTVLLPTTISKNIALQNKRNINYKKIHECLTLSELSKKIASLPYKEESLLVRELNENAVSFSGGELQKLCLAKSLYKDAPIMILDEPTAALDPIAENHVYLKYEELTENKTSIYISHRLASTKFCDRIILLENGKIVEEGTHEDLMLLNGKYAEMYKMQGKYYKNGGIDETAFVKNKK